ncbi:transcription initiation factor TFIID subunit 10 [Geosmithia morbida]|uniref:Transcription initiation factor TFIID subunit 10 n=1 Tax=Geosmithia morbida TaxID=1094350 RepID=A0A9P5CYM2_9HYPO|nr:transcription initiation factor TFIID subunit 10 [Geosmithia morbida]KAF4119552.1 transcription initiation factor TFIID subunit 10 [Geosmithia morbida]
MASEVPEKSDQVPAVDSVAETTTANDGGDINMEGTAAPGAATDAPGGGGGEDEERNPVAPGPELKLPTHKDVSLRELLHKMDDSAPIIPDAVTHYYMTKAGLPPPPQTDPRLARLLALATQKFIADVAADAYQYSRIRASNTNTNNPMGNLGAAAGFPVPGQHQGGAGQAGGAGGAGAVVSKDQAKGGAAGANAALGIQRPGYGGGGQGGSQNRTVLTMEDLGMAVGEYGVNVKRSEFYR